MSSLFQYRQLFSVQLLMEYYLTQESALYQDTPENTMASVLEQQHIRYDVTKDLEIQPTFETLSLLKDKRLFFKQSKTGFFVSSQVQALTATTFAPFLTFDEPFSLCFEVHLTNAYFCNFVNIRLEADLANKDHYLYYFTNRANNIDSNNLKYLHSPLSDFDPTYNYEASEIIIDRSDPLNPVMREAIENNGPGAFNAANWRDIYTDQDPLLQFVSNADRVLSRPMVFKLNTESAAQEHLIVTLTNLKGNIAKIIHFSSSEIGTPLRICELDLRTLKTGLYTISVRNNVGVTFPELGFSCYLDDRIYKKKPLAIIECFHEPDDSLGDYRWLDQDNQNRLRFPEYVIRWKNRATWWRYYFDVAPTFTATQIENYDADVNAPNHRILVSTTPIALTQLGREISINLGTGEVQLLPNPGINRIYPENGRIYSELNMGGGLGPPE